MGFLVRVNRERDVSDGRVHLPDMMVVVNKFAKQHRHVMTGCSHRHVCVSEVRTCCCGLLQWYRDHMTSTCLIQFASSVLKIHCNTPEN